MTLPCSSGLPMQHVREIPTFKGLSDDSELLRLFPAIRNCMIYSSRLRARTDIFPQTLAQWLKSVFDPIDSTMAPAIISAYGLELSATSNTLETTEAVLNFGNDVMFDLPTVYFTRAWSRCQISDTEAFLSRFNNQNLWDGPWKGRATHAQDVAFLFQNYRDALSAGQCKSAERFARDIITFTSGGTAWPPYEHDTKSGAMVYNASEEKDISQYVSDQRPEWTGRRDNYPTESCGRRVA
ncbi:hypothetical protein BKA61DRAFT_682499 [Leptodontidium sp. MPI-SDFR-AT-0119]|nr:hypothetical protein BKA61DRAFT_682499 [Leptodontidium sp. MPI-SDFR-AT-0119]